jgi:hypothetical protein
VGIAQGGNLETLIGFLAGLETEIATLSRQIDAYEPLHLTVTTDEIRRTLEAIHNLRARSEAKTFPQPGPPCSAISKNWY